MKYVIKMRWSDTPLAETNFQNVAEMIAETLYKKYNGKHVIYVEEKKDWSIVKGRYSYDGYMDYNLKEVGSE